MFSNGRLLSPESDSSTASVRASDLNNSIKCQELIRCIIKAEDPDRSREALGNLFGYGDTATQELIKIIRELPRDSADLPRAVDVLVQLSAFSREATEELVNLALHDQSSELRKKAALGMPKGVGLQLLAESLERGDGESSFRAATALGIMGEAGVVHLGRALENNPSLAVQLECVNWLVKILDFSDDPIAPLEKARDSNHSPMIKLAASRALSRMMRTPGGTESSR